MTETDLTTWVNGSMVSAAEPVVTPGDRGLIGDGVFEALKVVDGVAFAPTRHLSRLHASAAPLGIAIDTARIEAGIAAVLAAPRLRSGRFWLRVTVTGGVAAMGKAKRGVEPTVIISAAPLPLWAPTSTAVVVPWTRNERGALAGLKTLSYIENGIALRYAHAQGADEGLFANTIGNLCEGAGTNVFVVMDGMVKTPPLSAGALDGITRQLVLEWVPDIVEEDMPISVLRECQEAFITSTSRDVHAVARIDGEELPLANGPATQEIAAVFRERAALDPDPVPLTGSDGRSATQR
jgi:branched-chain amino acid aminotransferase